MPGSRRHRRPRKRPKRPAGLQPTRSRRWWPTRRRSSRTFASDAMVGGCGSFCTGIPCRGPGPTTFSSAAPPFLAMWWLLRNRRGRAAAWAGCGPASTLRGLAPRDPWERAPTAACSWLTPPAARFGTIAGVGLPRPHRRLQSRRAPLRHPRRLSMCSGTLLPTTACPPPRWCKRVVAAPPERPCSWTAPHGSRVRRERLPCR